MNIEDLKKELLELDQFLTDAVNSTKINAFVCLTHKEIRHQDSNQFPSSTKHENCIELTIDLQEWDSNDEIAGAFTIIQYFERLLGIENLGAK